MNRWALVLVALSFMALWLLHLTARVGILERDTVRVEQEGRI